MYNFDHISVKQRQLPDQQVDSDPWIVQLQLYVKMIVA